jgi:hypothetical protein
MPHLHQCKHFLYSIFFHGFKAFIVERQREGESREVEASHGRV